MFHCFHSCFLKSERAGESNYISTVLIFVTNGEEQSASVFFEQIQERCIASYLFEKDVLCNQAFSSMYPGHHLS